MTARFRPDKAKHTPLTNTNARNIIEKFGSEAKPAYTPTDNMMTYTNSQGKRIKLSFNEDGTFAKAETLTKKSES